MLFRDVVDLINMEFGTNENGFDFLSESGRETVFANKKSVRSNEFYLASQNGYKLEMIFEVRSSDYQGEKFLDYENKRYEIVRTYDKGEYIELSCRAYA